MTGLEIRILKEARDQLHNLPWPMGLFQNGEKPTPSSGVEISVPQPNLVSMFERVKTCRDNLNLLIDHAEGK